MTIAGSSNGRMLGSCPSDGGPTPPPATIWQRFARLIGVEERLAEDALNSERVAKHVVSRRSFIGAAGALAGAAIFSIPTPAQDELRELTKPKRHGSTLTTFDAMLKERYLDEGVTAFINPRDSDTYFKLLKLKQEQWAPAVVADPFVPLGKAYILDPENIPSFTVVGGALT